MRRSPSGATGATRSSVVQDMTRRASKRIHMALVRVAACPAPPASGHAPLPTCCGRSGSPSVVDAVKRRVRPVASDFTLDVRGLRMSGSSIGQLGQIRDWADGSKDGYMTEVFQCALEPGTAVIDVGAYLGYFTLLAARGVGVDGRVVAFEPHPDTRRALRENLAGNGVADRVVARRQGARRDAGHTVLLPRREPTRARAAWTPPTRARAPSAWTARGATTSSRSTTCSTSDACDAVKIDVEGREVEVLESLHCDAHRVASRRSSSSATRRPSRVPERPPRALLEAIAGSGFDAHVINEDARCLEPVPQTSSAGSSRADTSNLFCRASGQDPTAERKAERSILAARSMLNSERTRSRPAAP